MTAKTRRSGAAAIGPKKAIRGALRASGPHAAIDRVAEEAIFRHAQIMSEGAPSAAAGSTQYFGSTMVTVDLAQLSRDLRGLHEHAGRLRLLSYVEGSVRVHLRLMRLARADAWSRCPDGELGTANVEVRARISDGKLLMDVDLEAPLRRARADGAW